MRALGSSCSTGNGGSAPITLTNISPWITTVFPSTVKLRSSLRTFKGVSSRVRTFKGVSSTRVLSRTKQQFPLFCFLNPDPISFLENGFFLSIFCLTYDCIFSLFSYTFDMNLSVISMITLVSNPSLH